MGWCKLLLLVLLSTVRWLHLAEAQHQINICSTDEDSKDCKDGITLQKLASDQSLIQSDTILMFQPADFVMETLYIEHVSNITLDAMPGSKKPLLLCTAYNGYGDANDSNDYFLFKNVSDVTIKNIDFGGCGSHQSGTLMFITATNITISSVTIKDGRVCGVKFNNVFGAVTISNTLFTQMNGTSIWLSQSYEAQALPTQTKPSFTIMSSDFTQNNCSYSEYSACTLYANLGKFPHPSTIDIKNINIGGNTQRCSVSDIYIHSSWHTNEIFLSGYHREGNSIFSGLSSTESCGSDFLYIHKDGINEGTTAYVHLHYSTFINNAVYGDTDNYDPFDIGPSLYSIITFNISGLYQHILDIRDCLFTNNTGRFGSAVYYDTINTKQSTNFHIMSSTFANNTIYSSDYYKKGVVVLKHLSNGSALNNCSIINNTGTGLLLESSKIGITDIVFRGNHAYNGGAMGLWDSTISLRKNLTVVGNTADNMGGGLYVKSSAILNSNNASENECFLTVVSSFNPTLHLASNQAQVSGNDIYGGDLYTCEIAGKLGIEALKDILSLPDNYTVDVASNPLRVCDYSSIQACYNNDQIISKVVTYSGQKFSLSLIAVGQLLNTSTSLSGVPSSVYASLLSISAQGGNIPEAMKVQHVERLGTKLKYLVNSNNTREVLALAISNDIIHAPGYFVTMWEDNSRWLNRVQKVVLNGLLVPAYVEIELKPCPVGFELINSVCTCSADIQDFVSQCFIDEERFQRKDSCWIGVDNQNNSELQGEASSIIYQTYQHCPFDYCRSGTFNFSLNNTDQCDNNRAGILCGECKPGYSLMLGSTECRHCTDIHLLLLIPFAVAGVGLIAFLSLTDMTVTSGTINGLLFYANVLMDNRATFLPQQIPAYWVLPVFVSWLNLDFGINSCFYDGMDAYAYTWLQMSFPMYIWLLECAIIITYRYRNRLPQSNIVSVLATLFLLSYTKLLRTVITSLSFAIIKVSEGKPLIVWLKDGNVNYFVSKHGGLFAFSIVLLLLLLVFTFLILLGPKLQQKSHYWVFSWVPKFKHLFDAYCGPLVDQHRYWAGVLLLARLVLGLVSTATNAFGDNSINLLSIIVINIILLNILWQSGSVYKNWYVTAVESSFLANLTILSSLTLYNKLSRREEEEDQLITFCVSTGVAFITFCLIFIYHCVKRFEKKEEPLITPTDRDDEVIAAGDEDRKTAAGDEDQTAAGDEDQTAAGDEDRKTATGDEY